MEKRKYFFFDIDQTLAVGEPGSQYVPDSVWEGIRILREKGHFLAIATGRSEAMARPVMESFGFRDMVCDGGNGLVLDNRLVEQLPLDREKCLTLIEECRQKGFAWGYSPDNTRIRTCPDDRFLKETDDRYMECRVVEGLDPSESEKIFKVYVACRYPQEYQLETLKELPWMRYGPSYIFVEPTDKARGIRRILKILGGDPADVVVFGDSGNDLTMFTKEWTCIAMGNGTQELKDAATFVTKDAADDGIWYALKHFGWI